MLWFSDVHDCTFSSKTNAYKAPIDLVTSIVKFSRLLALKILFQSYAWADPEGGGTGGPDPPPLKNHKNSGFLSKSGPDPLKNHKATKPAFNVGKSSAHLNGVSLACR